MNTSGVGLTFSPVEASAPKTGIKAAALISGSAESTVLDQESRCVMPCPDKGLSEEAHLQSSAEQEGGSHRSLARIGAGALAGIALVTSVAAAAPPSQNITAQPSQETPVTMILEEEAPGMALEYTHSSDNLFTVQNQEFPRELDLAAEKAEALAGTMEFEDTQVFRILPNVEYHDALRVDVYRPVVSEEVDAPPEAQSLEGQNLDQQGNIVSTDAQAPAAKPATKTVEHQRELTPFGVDLGNGLFYDINGNLTFNPLRVVGEFSSATVDPTGLGNSTAITSRENRITIDRPGLFNSVDITKSAGKIVIDEPGFWNDTITLYQKDGKTTIDPPGLNTWLGRTEISAQGNRVTYDPPGTLNSTTVTKNGRETRITIPGWMNDVVITEEGNTIRIQYPGWMNDTVITRSGDRITVDPAGWGNSITITRTGNHLRVDPAGLNNSTTITIR